PRTPGDSDLLLDLEHGTRTVHVDILAMSIDAQLHFIAPLPVFPLPRIAANRRALTPRRDRPRDRRGQLGLLEGLLLSGRRRGREGRGDRGRRSRTVAVACSVC